MNNLLEALHGLKPIWIHLLVPSLAAGGGLVLIAWGCQSIFVDTGFAW